MIAAVISPYPVLRAVLMSSQCVAFLPVECAKHGHQDDLCVGNDL